MYNILMNDLDDNIFNENLLLFKFRLHIITKEIKTVFYVSLKTIMKVILEMIINYHLYYDLLHFYVSMLLCH